MDIGGDVGMIQVPRERANAAIAAFLLSRDRPPHTPAQQRILAAFLRLAANGGLESVTMRTLGRELGMKAPSLYSSFPQGKREIAAASLLSFTHDFARGLLAAASDAGSAEEYWATLVRFHLSHQLLQPESELWDLVIATDRVTHFLSDEVRDEVGALVGFHEDMFAAAAEEMGYSLTTETTRVIFTLLDGVKRWGGRKPGQVEFAEVLDRAVTLTRSILELSQTGTSLPLQLSIL